MLDCGIFLLRGRDAAFMRLENILEMLLVGVSGVGAGKMHHAWKLSRKHPGVIISRCVG